jgi:hypothetical protein
MSPIETAVVKLTLARAWYVAHVAAEEAEARADRARDALIGACGAMSCKVPVGILDDKGREVAAMVSRQERLAGLDAPGFKAEFTRATGGAEAFSAVTVEKVSTEKVRAMSALYPGVARLVEQGGKYSRPVLAVSVGIITD